MDNNNNFQSRRIHIRKRTLVQWLILLPLSIVILFMLDENGPSNPTIKNVEHEPAHHKSSLKAYGNIPMHFEANQGQTDGQVKFISRDR